MLTRGATLPLNLERWKPEPLSVKPPSYSTVIPVFNSAGIVKDTIDACVRFFEEHGLHYEIVLVDDGSSDASWDVLRERAAANPHIVAVRLLRNYGQHSAVHCGMAISRGDRVVILDDDLQNPPSEIQQLIDKADAGHDLVFGRFRRKRHSLARRMGSWITNHVNTAVFDKPHDLVLTNFKLLQRPVVDRILSHRTHFPYINGLALLYARRPADVLVEHRMRTVGKSNYRVPTIVSLLTRVLFNYSAFPLRLVTTIGLVAALLSLGVAAYVFTKAVVGGTTVPGWASTMVIFTFFNGITLLVLGILGEYIVRILKQTSMTEPYHVIEIDRSPND